MFTGTRVPGTWHQEGEEFCLEAMTIWDPSLLWLKEVYGWVVWLVKPHLEAHYIQIKGEPALPTFS